MAALINLPAHLGYWALAAFVGVETMGVPVPGETALIAASLLAAEGKLQIEFVIAIAAAAAIVGDNIGFVIGRKVGRRAFEWEGGPYPEKRRDLLDRGQEFFDRHGGKAVFLGRWVAGLRITSAWLAGINKMDWRRFFFWNALGGVCWATSVALVTYFVGHAAKGAIEGIGLGALGLGAAVGIGFALYHVMRRRRQMAKPSRYPRRDQPSAAGGPKRQAQAREHESQ